MGQPTLYYGVNVPYDMYHFHSSVILLQHLGSLLIETDELLPVILILPRVVGDASVALEPLRSTNLL